MYMFPHGGSDVVGDSRDVKEMARRGQVSPPVNDDKKKGRQKKFLFPFNTQPEASKEHHISKCTVLVIVAEIGFFCGAMDTSPAVKWIDVFSPLKTKEDDRLVLETMLSPTLSAEEYFAVVLCSVNAVYKHYT